MTRDTVVFWFEHAPKVDKGAFNEFSRLWEADVIYVINKELRKERKQAKWDDNDFGKAKVVYLYKSINRTDTINEIFKNYPHSIHVLNGFKTPIICDVIDRIIKEKCKVVLYTERPVCTGSFVERHLSVLPRFIKYTFFCLKYRNVVSALLPLGRQGVSYFSKCGFPNDKIYDFMYSPNILNISSERDFNVHFPIKFLYIGRFFYRTKGTDTLLEAIEKLNGDWSLTMVGGYGSDADDVLKRIRNNKKVEYVGTWDISSVVANIQKYDIVVIPSKADGWNLLVNEALHAGVTVICSDESVSHELITHNSNGLVFKAYNSNSLAENMQYAIDNPKAVSSYIKEARKLICNINCKTVGKYFKNILEYEIYNEGNKPKCPWI